jgi:hypothetical protein
MSWNALGLQWLERLADYLLPYMWRLASRRLLLRNWILFGNRYSAASF